MDIADCPVPRSTFTENVSARGCSRGEYAPLGARQKTNFRLAHRRVSFHETRCGFLLLTAAKGDGFAVGVEFLKPKDDGLFNSKNA